MRWVTEPERKRLYYVGGILPYLRNHYYIIISGSLSIIILFSKQFNHSFVIFINIIKTCKRK